MKIAGARDREFSHQQDEYRKLILAAYEAGEEKKAKRLTGELEEKARKIKILNRETVFVDLNDTEENSKKMMMDKTFSISETEETKTLDFTKDAKIRKPPKELDQQTREIWLERERDQLKDFQEVARQMARAIDLSSPARRGHFLRDFGQSDRDIIDNSSSHASVPQSLYLLNSPLAVAIANRNSVLGSELDRAISPIEKISVIYRTMLTREPTERETNRILTDYQQYGDETFEDLVWALLNSRQFLFIQ